MSSHYLEVKHNIEVAHRLHLLEGKCENIHGHSMWVTLRVFGELDANGIMEGISFTDLKQVFRHYLDTKYDHHLLLHQDDPWAQPLSRAALDVVERVEKLPGLVVFGGDPTTENLAKWIGEWAVQELALDVHCYVQETSVNASGWTSK